ncbi:YybH family protein [Spirillospora sp. CA-294931]|uniref:YybH family protein n=1 Tax=Spirillospora sp. CA-294931 TaxID=3240042 RepID=UPI003D948CCB
MSVRPSVREIPGEGDLKELRELVAELAEGFNRKEAAVLDRPFAADAVVVVPDGRIIRGWDELFAYHTARLAEVVSTWTMRQSVLSATMLGPDEAVLHIRQEMATPEREFANHGTVVASRRDGRWWISALHNTNVVG